MIGTTLLHYRLLRLLGKGGMGEVYLAEDIKLERQVALKMLPEALRHDPVRLARFRNEAKAAAKLNHPNIATIYTVEETLDLMFIIMEYVEGQPQEGLTHPALSPDGRQVAVYGTEQGNTDIWIHDVARGTKIRLTTDPGGDLCPAWSPRGNQIAFHSFRRGNADIYLQATDGSGEAQPLVTGPQDEYIPNWLRDGKYLAYHANDPKTDKRDLWYLSFTGDRKPVRFTQTPFHELFAVLSPDGKYVAYTSDEPGRWEVYVKPFPQGEGRWPVSVKGGVYPRWNGRGDELFYVEGDTLMVVKVDTKSGFSVEAPQKLFTGNQVGTRLYNGGLPAYPVYDVTADGKRFVVVQGVGTGTATITVVQNWVREFDLTP